MRLAAVAAAVIAVLSVFVATATGRPETPPAAKVDRPPGPADPQVDRDRDKIFDDLERRLAGRPSSSRVRVIVQLRDPASAARVAGLEREVGDFSLKDRYSVIDAFAATVDKGQVRQLAAEPEVERVEEDAPVSTFNSSAQSSFGVTKARSDNPVLDGDADGNPAAYSKDDMVAAVIDTGIDGAHPDLDEGKVIGFKDFVGDRTTAYDDNDHGTHVAATIAGEGDNANADGRGSAPGAALVGVKVLDAKGSGYMSDVVAGIDWVVQEKANYGIEAINLSLGTSGCSDGTSSDSQAVNRANDAGIVVAVAAGNSGPGTCTVGSPGAADRALTVGAMADMGANGFKQAYFSSRGKTADGRMKPDVSAPGVAITSADANTTGYVTFNGTSMATPFVAGTALLMLDANPALTPAEVKAKVQSTAVDWGRGDDNRTAGSSGADLDYGAGRLDSYAAIKSAGGAGAALTTGPPMPAHELKEGSLPGSGAQVDYQLNVTDTQFPIAATLIHPSVTASSASSPDFDLYLYDPNGTQVAKAETSRRQDEIGFKPTVTGTYTLRVRSYSGSGGYFVDTSAGTGADTTPPTVSSVSPSDGATEVGRAGNVSATFDEPMNRAATEAAFSLVRTSDGAPATGTFSWSGNTMTFDPTADLDSGAQYTAKVAGGSGGATDAAGNALAADRAWSFTTTSFVAATAFPSATAIESGGLRSGTAADLGSDDNFFYSVNSTTSGTRTSSWYGSFTGISNRLTNLKVSYSGKNSRSCSQTVAIWRWTDSKWVALDSRSVGTTEVAISNRTPPDSLAGYVGGPTGDSVRVRVRCTRSSGSFYSSGDLLKLDFERP